MSINHKQITFVIYSNDDKKYTDSCNIINSLYIPNGYNVSITRFSGDKRYSTFVKNSFIKSNESKYKIYINEDVYIADENFLVLMLDIFRDTSIGCFGYLGALSISSKGLLNESKKMYGSYYYNKNGDILMQKVSDGSKKINDVSVLAPGFIATQYDVPIGIDLTEEYTSNWATIKELEYLYARTVVVTPPKPFIYMHSLNLTCDNNDLNLFLNHYYQGIYKKVNILPFKWGKNIIFEGTLFKSESISIGMGTIIHESVKINCLSEFNEEAIIDIGEFCEIKKNTNISINNFIKIHDNVSIGSNVIIKDISVNKGIVGIPLSMQNVKEKNKGISIGKGTQIGDNVVIEGSCNIGKNVLIKNNSYITSDIPDYCVVSGNPSKIINIYDFSVGSYVNILDDRHFKNVLKKNASTKVKPILTVGIPTYNRCNYLRETLYSILKQLGDNPYVEIIVVDNASDDNTNLLIEELRRTYPNIKYYINERNIGMIRNIFRVYELGEGEFILSTGSDDPWMENVLYGIYNCVCSNIDKSILLMKGHNGPMECISGKGTSEYILEAAANATFLSAVIIKKEIFSKVLDYDKYHKTLLSNVYLQLKMLQLEPNFCIIKSSFLWKSNMGMAKTSGYDYGEVFIKYYFDIVKCNSDLSEEGMIELKLKIFKEFFYPWVSRWIKLNYDFSKENFMKYFKEYYEDVPFYAEAKKYMEDALAGKGMEWQYL